jgi:hypothetical protein
MTEPPTIARSGDRWAVAGEWYRLTGTTDGPVAVLEDLDGVRWAELRLLASVDTRTGDDETFTVVGPVIDASDGSGATEADATTVRLTWELGGSVWAAKRLIVEARRDTLAVRVEVEGAGDLTTVSVLAGRVVQPRATGLLMSGAWFESVVAASPGDPGRIVTPASESVTAGVASGSEPGRGRWFFTPPPFVVGVSRSVASDPVVVPAGPWLSFALDAVRGESGFTELAYRAMDRGFGFVLDYDGHTQVQGRWSSPPLVLTLGPDPYAGIRAQRDRLVAATGTLSGVTRRAEAMALVPDWWREPLFCGWGAQCADAASAGLPMSAAAAQATEPNYDRWLAHLEARDIVPGTVVLDDKWQLTYGDNEPDPAKWPDLPGWINDRHRRGQHVLLWYKAWDAEGLPPELCIRTTTGTALGLDPTNPDGEAAIRRSVHRMLSADGLDADGLKIDFTARTPTGRSAVAHGGEWGVDLLARLLEILADEARRAKPDALLIAHSPNPIVASSVGMIRLNDALRLDDPRPAVDVVPQMRYRAAVARAACPDHLVDTDDWCAPDLAGWRAYNAIKAQLGVPALYYATHLDRTGERLTDEDYALIRDVWSAYRTTVGLRGNAGS